jgi:hypothetical protein
MQEICTNCNENTAEVYLNLTNLGGFLLDRIKLCIPCAGGAHVNKRGDSFIFCDDE